METHHTLISGTAYTIKGGSVLIAGTKYQIGGGTAEVDGTKRSIKFSEPVAITIEIVGTAPTSYADVTYKGTTYADAVTIESGIGDTLEIRVEGSNQNAKSQAYVELNGTKVMSAAGTYSYVVKQAATISLRDRTVRVLGKLATAGQATITEE